MSKTYTHKDLSKALKVSETSIKSYRRKFPGCIPIASRGRPIHFEESSLEVVRKIRDYFALGMEVKEVRLRLAEEFSWIRPEAEKGKNKNEANSQALASPEISQGVSNMAKSMVTMSTHQNNIMKRMQAIEQQLENLGLKGQSFNELREIKEKEGRSKEEFLNERLSCLDSITSTLAETVSVLLGKIDGIVASQKLGAGTQSIQEAESYADSNTVNIVPNGKNGSEDNILSADNEIRNYTPKAAPGDKKPYESDQQTKATVISFKKEDPESYDIGKEEVLKEILEGFKKDEEAPREYHSIPLVVRMDDGRYFSAGPKAKGRFCINDLKAMLIHAFSPPNHFNFSWVKEEDGWWLILEQPELKEEQISISMQFRELSSKKSGENVLEIIQLRKGLQVLHPAGIFGIIDKLSASM